MFSSGVKYSKPSNIDARKSEPGVKYGVYGTSLNNSSCVVELGFVSTLSQITRLMNSFSYAYRNFSYQKFVWMPDRKKFVSI